MRMLASCKALRRRHIVLLAKYSPAYLAHTALGQFPLISANNSHSRLTPGISPTLIFELFKMMYRHFRYHLADRHLLGI